MIRFHLPLFRLARLLTLGAAVGLAGCASTGSLDAQDGTSVGGDAQPAGSAAGAGDAAGSPQSARRSGHYGLQGSVSPGAIGSVVVTNPLAPRTLDLTRHPDDIWERIRTGFAIPNLDTPLVAEQQAWYLAHPESLRRSFERSGLYMFHIVEELNKRDMPTELALLPFVESSYNPMAYSRAHASGMWQFVPGTGKTYNLKQDWWRDERRDVVASTDAALTYLKTIYEMNGDWHLALASYNWGENAVKRAVDRNQAAGLPTDYLSLPMPDETRNYVPKLQALKNIIANPEAFGVTLPRIENEPYFVAVERDRDIDIQTAAKLANMSVSDFKALNPSFNRPVIRGSSNVALLVPTDRANDFRSALQNQAPLATWQAHTVAKKETLERIAAKYGMTAAALREVNGLGPGARVRPGQGLLVQKKGEGDVALRFASFSPPEDTPMFQPIGGSLSSSSSYEVRRGDTLTSIARRLNVSPAKLRDANRLKHEQVEVGQQLKLPGDAAKLVKVSAPAGREPTPRGAPASKATAERHAPEARTAAKVSAKAPAKAPVIAPAKAVSGRPVVAKTTAKHR